MDQQRSLYYVRTALSDTDTGNDEKNDARADRTDAENTDGAGGGGGGVGMGEDSMDYYDLEYC